MSSPGSQERVIKAFNHEQPDRTPLFEIFQPFHPIHWDICGRTVATDEAMCWDAMAEGISWEELLEEEVKAQYEIRRFFGLDMVRLNGAPRKNYVRPVKTGPTSWQRGGIDYILNERTRMVEFENPAQALADSQKISEEDLINRIESWDGTVPEPSDDEFILYEKVRAMADKDGIDWHYMGEIGAGTGVAFYPPFQLMWLIAEPELFNRWISMVKVSSFKRTEEMIKRGYSVIAMGGDVSCDKGPFISPAHYHEFILPVVREHVELIHRLGALAVYTSDGNHWPIKEDFFFNSGVDGYKEVDKAAGMTMERLLEEGIDRHLCIIGNIDARHVLCHGTEQEVREEVISCLRLGQRSPGGHILHNSHSVHEDVISANYITVIKAYREYFGMESLEI